MKPKLLSRGLAIFSLMAIALTGCGITTDAAEAYVTIDINPSFGLMINENGEVSLANALNGDGEMVMLQLQLEGKKADAAIAEIVEEATALEFIDPEATETLVEVDAISGDAALQAQIRTQVETHLNTAFAGESAQVRVETRTYTEGETSEAETKGVTALQYRLMKQAMIGNDDLTEEDAAALGTEALLAKVKAGATQMKAIAATYGQEYLDAKQAIHDEYLPQIQAVRTAIAEAIANSLPTTELEAQLAALQLAMSTAIKALVDEYKQKTVTAREQWQTQANGIKAGGNSSTGSGTASSEDTSVDSSSHVSGTSTSTAS